MKTLFTLLFVAVHAMAISQTCSFTGTTQADLDNFIIENPTCTVLDGSVIIDMPATQIWQFNGFSNIEEITGDLTLIVWDTQQDPDFSGFSHLNTIGGVLSILQYGGDGLFSHPSIITDLYGFHNLTSVGSIGLAGLSAITDLDEFNNITTLENLNLEGEFSSLQNEIFPNLVTINNAFNAIYLNAPHLIGFNNLISAGIIYWENGWFQNLDVFQNLENTDMLILGIAADEINGFDHLTNCSSLQLQIPSYIDWSIIESSASPNFPALNNCSFITLQMPVAYAPEFPSLTECTNITIENRYQNISFTALQSVLGNLKIGEWGQNPYGETIDFGQLNNISGDLLINALNISNLNMTNLTAVGGELTITNCPNLAMCDYEFICNKIELQPELIDIHDNGIGCSTLEEIASNCGDLYIQGNVFVDMDCNGSFNSGDVAVSNPIILNETNNPIGASTISGDYLFIAQQNTSYTFGPALIPGIIDYSPITLTTGPDNTPFTNNNFALCPDLLYHDLAVTVSNVTLSPGFTRIIYFNVENLGYNEETVSLNTVLSLLNNLVINTSSHPYSTSLNTITFDDFTIGVGETITVTLNVTLDASIQLGTLNSIQADVTNGPTDNDLSNNQDSFQNVVIGSYDPNDITVDREAIDFTQVNQNGEWLVYQIRFQNTGNAPAQFINVVNEQDLDLDMSTIDMIAASHSYELIFNGREITWFFDNIQLPDSTTDLLGSQGYILFRIKTNPGITLDEVIESSAAIYFDYNEPVITNTATTEFYVCPESISAAGNTTYCEGETVMLTANTGYETYNWSLASDIIGTEQTFSADWSAGIYAIEYSGSTLYCISSSVIEIIVNDNPETPSITQNGNTLTASGSGTFTWLYNDQLLNDTDNTIEITESGDYSVSVSANGCTSETSQNNFTYIGINENDLVKMSVFPNPFTDIISLQLPSQTEKITVTDVSGKIVFEKTNIATSSIKLDLSFLEAGSYFITVISANGAVSEGIVKGTN